MNRFQALLSISTCAVESTWFERLKLTTCDTSLSNVTFNFNMLRPYVLGLSNGTIVERAAHGATPKAKEGKKGPLARLSSLEGKEAGASRGVVSSPLYSHENGVVSLKEPPGNIRASEPVTDEEMLQAWGAYTRVPPLCSCSA